MMQQLVFEVLPLYLALSEHRMALIELVSPGIAPRLAAKSDACHQITNQWSDTLLDLDTSCVFGPE